MAKDRRPDRGCSLYRSLRICGPTWSGLSPVSAFFPVLGLEDFQALILCGSVVVIMVLHCILDGVKGSENVSEGGKRDDIVKTL